jgi:alpha,alpha-trehalase
MKISRREVLTGVAALAASAGVRSKSDAQAPRESSIPDRRDWQKLDDKVRSWWDQDQCRATEEEIRADKSRNLKFLPFPYAALTSGPIYRTMFPYDTGFMNLALLAHERLDLVRNHILNYLFLIDRYGFFPNSNVAGLLTRSHANFVPGTIWRYYLATQDHDLLATAYPLLKREFKEYWNAPHHQTPIGLATNRDLGDPLLSPELASEAETAMDWMPIYGGDVRRCAPVSTNCILVRYARTLALIAERVGRASEAKAFANEADRRAGLIRKYCWNDKAGVFLEYDYVADKQLPYISECGFWTLWAGVATEGQGHRLRENISLLEKPYGLAVTDKAYEDPHPPSAYLIHSPSGTRNIKDLTMPDASPEYLGGRGPLMWMYPAGWASTQLMIVDGLDTYGCADVARRICARFLSLVMDQYRKTGELWEKYNVVDGTLVLPNSRYGNIPYHSFTAAAVVLLGRRLFEDQHIRST